MIQEERNESACVCPECGYRCNACLGTGTAISRDALQKLRGTDWFTPDFNSASDDEEADSVTPESPDAPTEF